MTIGERIKAARRRKGMTQNDLATALHIPYQGISQYERGIRNPKYGTVAKIAKVLGCDISELLTPHEESQMIIQHIFDRFDSFPTGTKPEVINITSDMLPTSFPTVEDRISYYFSRLNDEGKEVAADRVQELTEIPKYKKKKEEASNAPQDNP